MRVVIMGGGYAGLMTALRLAGKDRQQQVQLTLVDAHTHFQERIRHHQYAAGDGLRPIAYEQLLRRHSVDFVCGYVQAIQPETHSLSVHTPQGTQTLSYDRLVLTLGSLTDVQSVQGVAQHALTLDARHREALKRALSEANQRAGDVLIVGAGLTGIESALEWAERYPQARIHLLNRSEIGANLSKAGQAYLRQKLESYGIRCLEGRRVIALEAQLAYLEDGSQIGFTCCVWAASFIAPRLAAEAGLKVNERGQVLVDEGLRSLSHPSIYASGDSAQFATVTYYRPRIRMACATAMPMGAHLADNLLAEVQGRPLVPFGFQYLFQGISLGRRSGLIQFVRGDDSPREFILTGRLAALFKEVICRFTVWAIWAERRWAGIYMWLGRHSARQHHKKGQSHGYSHRQI